MNNSITIGMDLGDKFHMAVVFDNDGKELETTKVTNTKTGISKFFKPYSSAQVAIEQVLTLHGSAGCLMKRD